MSEVRGWFSYKGVTTLQHEDAPIVFKQLFENAKPSQVLEIGTSYGGLTWLVRDLLDEVVPECKLRSYDVLDITRPYVERAISEGKDIELIKKSVFNHMYDRLIDAEIPEVRDYIQREGCTVVLCDGGSKKNEFRILAEHLKPGDIILAHDYAPNREYFEEHIREKIWNWHEIEDLEIQGAVEAFNLEPFMQEDFQKIVWVCKIRK